MWCGGPAGAWIAPFDPLTGDLRKAYLLAPGAGFSWERTPRAGMSSAGSSTERAFALGGTDLAIGIRDDRCAARLLAGYYGRWVDALVMRLADITLAFPTLLLLIAVAAAVKPSLPLVFVVIGVVGWAGMARLVRSQVLVLKSLRVRGSPPRRWGPSTGVSCCATCYPTCGLR